MPKRFQQILAQELDGPFAVPTDADVARIVQRLEAADVEDMLDELAAMSAERDEIEEWDGDTLDDIARAQAFVSRLLGAMPGYRAAVSSRIASADPVTTAYLRLILGEN